jgi:hypothetical protein
VRFPILITCRDRLSPLVELLTWLERSGQDRIYLLDNASTYPPLLEFYERTSHRVIRLGVNIGQRAAWEAGIVEQHCAGDYYVVSDPDVVLVEDCPPDVLDVFYDALLRFPTRCKTGFGLKIDDLPDHYRFAQEVRTWEAQFWERELAPGLYDVYIDTTFALYRPGVPFQIENSIRTGKPYIARHTAWYTNSGELSEEERYYREHARPGVTHWNAAELPSWLAEEVARRRAGEQPGQPADAEAAVANAEAAVTTVELARPAHLRGRMLSWLRR